MTRIAFVAHPERPDASRLALEALRWVEEQGHEAVVPADDGVAGFEAWAVPAEQLATGLDLAVSVGGDGTLLRAVGMVAAAGVPVIGVNVGHLGYLTEVEPDGLIDALKAFLAGDHQIERRMALAVEAGGRSLLALNEVVLEKTESGHTVRLAVSIAGVPFTTYAADGLIVATPTGSTAYNLSARGPIVSPGHRALLITPVSPHMLFDRTLVLDPTEAVAIEVIDARSAQLVVDGRPQGPLQPGDVVRCSASPHDVALVTFGRRDFHRILKAKFGLADR
jgi:NAD+ kinase